MDCVSGAEDRESLPILQVNSWGPVQLDLTEVKEASLSPGRDFLLLLSHNCEALLLPLQNDLRKQALTASLSSLPVSPQQPASPKDHSQDSAEPKFYTPLSSKARRFSSPNSLSMCTPEGTDILQSTPFYTPAYTSFRNCNQAHDMPSYNQYVTPEMHPSSSYMEPSSTGRESPSCSTSSRFPCISDVRSSAWGCPGDECTGNEYGGNFKQLLFVSGKRGLIVHAFCSDELEYGRTSMGLNASREAGGKEPADIRNASGRLVNWGPAGVLDDCFADVAHSSEQSNTYNRSGFQEQINITGEVGGRGNEKTSGTEDSSRNSTSKRWLESFLIDMEMEESGGNINAKFPMKSSIPSSAKVVSFYISCTSSAFLHFIRSGGKALPHATDDPGLNSIIKKEQESREMNQSLTTGSVQPLDSWSGDKNCSGVVSEKFSSTDRNNGLKITYEFSKLFSSPSHRVVGMVLTGQGCISEAVEKCSSKPEVELFLLVAMVHEWGISWTCSVDLQNLALSLMPDSCWSAFQLSEDVLFGLKESGNIFMWAAMTGQFVGYIDVMYHCGLDLGPHTHMEEGPGQVNNSPEDEIEQSGTSRVEKQSGCETGTKLLNLQKSEKVRPGYCFRGLSVTANSLLIAATDKHGLVYVISTDEYFAGSEGVSDKSRSLSEPLNFSDLSVLSCWEVAGSSIGSQKKCSDLPNRYWLKSFTDGKGKDIHCSEEIASRSNRAACSKPAAIQVSPDSSGFVSNLHRKDRLIFSEGKNVQALRRVFLPSEQSDSDAIISLGPYGVTKLVHTSNLKTAMKEFKVVHASLRLAGVILEDRDLDANHKFTGSRYMGKEKRFLGEVIGFCSEGCLYMVSQSALHVVLPPLSVSPSVPRSSPRGQLLSRGIDVFDFSTQYGIPLSVDCKGVPYQPWQIEVLDRALVFDGLKEAEHLSAENGWSLKTTRLRRLQLALDYLQCDDIERALEALAAVNAAEEGVLQVLFTAVEQVLSKIGGDNEIAQASRLLALAAQFATKMVGCYGRLKWKRHTHQFEIRNVQAANFMESPSLLNSRFNDANISGKLCEMAGLLEVIRNLQRRVNGKRKRSIQGMEVGDEMSSVHSGPQNSVALSDSREDNLVGGVSIKVAGVLGSEIIDEGQGIKKVLASNGSDQLALSPLGNFISMTGYLNSGSFSELSVSTSPIDVRNKQLLPLENPKDMVRRWEVEQVDLTNVVKEALQSGRLPLAVLQLHRLHSRDLSKQREPYDVSKEVQEVGKTIVYDLFCEGKTALAIAALHRLGEDVEANLRELAFGTVRRSLRSQVTQELKKHSCLRSRDVKILERVLLLERLYPSGSFWSTYAARRRPLLVNNVVETLVEESKLKLICTWGPFRDYAIECGDIDGVVIGSWSSLSSEEGFLSAQTEDSASAGYWAGAAVWLDAWDQRTVDRVILDQPFFMGVHISWEAQFEYFIAHNDWEEVSKLLDIIPPSVLKEGTLHIQLDFEDSYMTSSFKKVNGTEHFSLAHSMQELDVVEMVLPEIKLLRFSLGHGCAMSMRKLIEEKLAENFIFLQDYWKGTQEIISLLASAGLIFNMSKKFPSTDVDLEFSDLEFSDIQYGKLQKDTVQAVHKLVLHHCIKHDLPHLLDFYLDSHSLALDNTSLSLMQAVAGDCHWAQWLLLSRIKGFEYDASFSNARSNLSRNVTPGRKLELPEIEDLIPTVDDMAEGGWEKAALATLMYAPVPLQRCLCSGSVNRHRRTSWQCTVENLRPALQIFPTLWRSLLAVCFGQEACSIPLSPTAKSVSLSVRKSGLFEYSNWRDGLFSSAGGDTSLLQMVPRWFPKAVRRLLQLSMQGPVGGRTAAVNTTVSEAFEGGRTNRVPDVEGAEEVDALSWEVALQKNIEEELYASSFEEGNFGVEHHLHRGRALAAFNFLIGNRAQKLNSLGHVQEQIGKSSRGQSQASSEIQVLLSQLTQSEEKLLISVIPLAIMHFENNALVASCAFLLELCGLSANTLRVDVASLCRISSFYHSLGLNEHSTLSKSHDVTRFSSSFEDHVATSLARALADEYMDAGLGILVERHADSSLKELTNHRLSRALKAVLQHLEKSSLPEAVNGQSPGSWLLTGEGDGPQLRAQQRAASERWSLVTTFCQMHHIPISTLYLSTLARDNDWVGFLAEAQLEGCSIDVVISVASKEFTDTRLKSHILTVLKGMQSSRQKVNSVANLASSMTDLQLVGTSSSHAMMPTELFGLVAEYEKQKCPGKELLVKAKDLRWPLLAIIASCFPDVSPLSCLTVWLEITAARETSAIKVNDVAAQIANSVGTAVEATNSLPSNSRALSFRYNRKNPKRRRLMEQLSTANASESNLGSTSLNPSRHLDTSSTSMSQGQKRVSEVEQKQSTECLIVVNDGREEHESLTKMVAVLCEQQLFLPLLKAFDLFIPSCSLLPFVRFLQAFSQMRLSEASAHLASFSNRLKEEILQAQATSSKSNKIATTWITSAAIKAADVMLSTCPSAYERRCLLQLLAAADFGDGGSASARFRRFYWKIQLADPALRQGADLLLDTPDLDDGALLTALEKDGHWEEARSWARQLELSGPEWKSAVHHVTETQAEAMVAEWKEFLWDVPGEQAALWSHCQSLFTEHSFPPLQAGMFFLKHAEAIEKDVPAVEVHGMLLLALQWLSGSMNKSNPVYPLHLLREIETRVWLLAVESEVEIKNGKGIFQVSFIPNVSSRSSQENIMGNNVSVIDHTANIIAKMDSHLNAIRERFGDQIDEKELSKVQSRSPQIPDASLPSGPTSSSKLKRRNKGHVHPKRTLVDNTEKIQSETEDNLPSSTALLRSNEHGEVFPLLEENIKLEATVAGWEEKVGVAELERSVLALLEVGQIAAAKQLQQKLSPTHVPSELLLVEEALKVAEISNPNIQGSISLSMAEPSAFALLQSLNLIEDINIATPLQVLEAIATKCREGCGRGLCNRILAVVKIANFLELSFSEAFQKQPIELLQLLSLKAQDSLDEARLLVDTHSMPAASIARILAESFLKGLLAAHRGGYTESSQREEGPAPLLWRASDFLRWAELCPSEPEVGHALMRLVITGHDMPHACEVELLILAHHFYKSSACLDGVDVLVALAATRVESYVAEGDFSCLARLVTGVSNFHALYFMLDILIENGQLELLLQKYAVADATTESAKAIQGFRMTILSALKHFNPDDLDAFAMVYNHFDMKHEMSALLELRARKALDQWLQQDDKEHSEELLEMMGFYVEAADVYSSIDAGNKTRRSCAQASLVSLQIRMPDTKWLNLTETNARRLLVEQSRFQEALIVAEAYNLNQSGEWVPVLWNQMLRSDLIDQFLAEFVAALPLPPNAFMELARFYRAEVTARGDQSQFSTWLNSGGLPLEWAKHLGKSFRSLLRQTRDVRLRIQLATTATGFPDIIEKCIQILDRVPETAGPLILRKGHGGAYLPLM
ncbi:hypothetical protein SUGI_0645700 [Cryptomeria japonica]|uniref:uncharacterized protein LOC131041273 n=1 Tax=Cryptomeria japonica TaxID=3369 RepID=UPI0024149DCF|nr:uncharacterized protein LOC131041273 [Cryptomeria japonica]XP_057830287.2 uncharacterized protein LOC131041273 [Cryptomeria japonica]XP_057830289.2 uncharacterized protein LOC131041273 [Cryptomeria japonica]GLJ32063.1 hypothetical protein SUGI_0645700 [Cryptomeria japonica]